MSPDEQLREACEAVSDGWLVYVDPSRVLDVLGRLGPVAALNLALREHRKRVSELYNVEIPDQSKWMSDRNEAWVEPQGH